MFEAYLIHILILVSLYLILALSLQLCVGFSGLINLGHIVFFGIGAYVSTILTKNDILPFGLALLVSAISASVIGLVMILLTVKLKGDYLALATLALTYLFYSVTINWTSMTGGPYGLFGIEKPAILGIQFSSEYAFLLLILSATGLTYGAIYLITSSPFGKVMEAVRDDELGAKILGKNVFLVKSCSLGIAAFFAATAGALHAHYVSYIDPASFTLMQLIPILSIVIVGGLASLKGTAIATLILIILPELLRFAGFPYSVLGSMRQMIFALILILILLYRPKGLFGRIELN